MADLTTYELQQGFVSPRDKDVVWTGGETFAYLDQAEAAAEKLTGKWRIVSHTIELTSEDE